jgi:hypothetical protein
MIDKLFYSVGLLTLGLAGMAFAKNVSHPADANLPAVPFVCPKSTGICFWSVKSGWKKVLATSPDMIVDFYQAKDGRLVSLLRGHGNPGRTIVATRAGLVQVVKRNSVEGSLQRLAGSDEQGNTVLCMETPEVSLCDTLVPSARSPAEPPWFPEGCLFPRFLSGTRACLTGSPKPALLLLQGENEVQRIGLPEKLSNPSDFHLVSARQFVFLAGETLYSQD